jgi:hypothetical protein
MTSGIAVEELELHREPFFQNFSVEGGGWSVASQRRAVRRARFWQSKGAKPKVEEVIAQMNLRENTSADEAMPYSHISRCHTEGETGG